MHNVRWYNKKKELMNFINTSITKISLNKNQKFLSI